MLSPYPRSLSAALVATSASEVCQALDCISVHYCGFAFVVHGGVYLVFELARSLQISLQTDYLSLLFGTERMCLSLKVLFA